jgi:hypothetical protein
LLGVAGPWAAAAEENAEQEAAIGAIKQMKGFVELDAQRPGKLEKSGQFAAGFKSPDIVTGAEATVGGWPVA